MREKRCAIWLKMLAGAERGAGCAWTAWAPGAFHFIWYSIT